MAGILASSSRAQLRYIRESNLGVTPAAEAGSQVVRKLRMTGESLDLTLRTTSSNEIRSDRMTPDNILVGASAGGGFNFEWSYQEFDSLLEGVLQGTWNNVGTGGRVTVTGSFAGNVLTASTGTPFAQVVAGQWVRVTGALTAVNNGIFKCTARTTAALTLIKYDPRQQKLLPAFTFTSEAATPNIVVSTSRLTNGATFRTFSIEKEFSDVGQVVKFAGMSPSKMSLNFASGSVVGGNFDFMGMSAARATATLLPAPGGGLASQAYSVMNAITGLGSIQESGTDLSASTYIKSLSMSIDNNLRGQEAIGVVGYAGVGSGTLKITGQIECYFADGALYQKFLDSASTSLSFTLVDALDGDQANGYAVTLPKIKFTDGKIQAGSNNQDVMVSMGYEALLDPATNAMILLDRFGATVVVA